VPFADRSVAVVLAARSAGPLETQERFTCRRLPDFGAVRARRLNGEGRDALRTGTRRVGRSRIGRFGFWVSRAPVCGRPVPAFVFSGAGASCLGLSPLSGFTDAGRRAFTAACTYGRKRMLRRVPPFARSRLSRGRIRSWVSRQPCRPRGGSGKQYQARRLSSCDVSVDRSRVCETRRHVAVRR
jgi:hypothetical protein